MKTARQNNAAWAYLASMPDTSYMEKATVPKPRPRLLTGGCLLYRLPNSRRQQHPPTPYYS